MNKLFHHLQQSTAPAFHFGDHTRTFADLFHRGARYAAALQSLGVTPGDRVVVLLHRSLDLIDILVGHHRLGAIHVPVNHRYGPREIAHIIADADPSVVVTEPALATKLPDLDLPILQVGPSLDALIDAAPPFQPVDLHDDDPALFIYTSGTTGPSKGVIHTYATIVAGIDALTREWRFTPDDHLILALPLFHVHGLCIGVHGTLLRGNQTTLLPDFDPTAVATALGDQGTIFMGVPTMHHALLEAMEEDPQLARAISRARLLTSGSAALPRALFQRIHELTGLEVLERYGMSETLLTLTNPYDGPRQPGTVGRPIDGVEARVVDDDGEPVPDGEPGALEVRGPCITPGYWRLPDKTADAFTPDGFFRTGDVVTRSPDGVFSILGRQSVDIIKSGGFKISAREIEETLLTHPDIRACAVIGVPHEKWGQSITAAIVPSPSATPRTSDAWLSLLRHHVAQQLADYKRPSSVLLLDKLPRNALGKVQKHRLI